MTKDGGGFDISKLFSRNTNSEPEESGAKTPKNDSQTTNRYDDVDMSDLFLPQYLGPELEPSTLEERLRALHRTLDPDFPFVDDDEPTHGIMDSHGNKYDLLKAISTYIKKRLDRKPGRLFIDGELCDPIYLIDNEGNAVGPAYPDYSIKAVPIVRKIQEWMGNGNIVVVKSDHLISGLKLQKFGKDSTDITFSKLNSEEKKFHNRWAASLPLCALINKVFLAHAGSIPALEHPDELKEARKNLEKYLRGEKTFDEESKFRAPPFADEDNYNEKIISFFRDAITGQAIMGELRLVTFIEKGGEKERLVRIISKERNARFLRNMKRAGFDIDQIYSGHHGAARVVYLDKEVPGRLYVEGARVYAEIAGRKQQIGIFKEGVEKHFTKYKQTIIATSEGSWSQKTERKEDEPCSKASWFGIYESEPNTLLLKEVGKDFTSLDRIPLDYEDLESLNLAEQARDVIEEKYRKGAIHPKQYAYFIEKGFSKLLKGVLAEDHKAIAAAESIIEFKEDGRKDLVGVVEYEYFRDNMYPKARKYLEGGLFK